MPHTFMILSSVLSAALVTATSEVVGSDGPVTAEAGGDVILPCSVRPERDVTALTVEWTLREAVVHMYKSRRDNLDLQDERFQRRTSLFPKEMSRGNISLKLNTVSDDDAGVYTCHVPRLEAEVRKGKVALSVVKKKNSGGKHVSDASFKPKKTDHRNLLYILPFLIFIIIIFALYKNKNKLMRRMRNHLNPANNNNSGDSRQNVSPSHGPARSCPSRERHLSPSAASDAPPGCSH